MTENPKSLHPYQNEAMENICLTNEHQLFFAPKTADTFLCPGVFGKDCSSLTRFGATNQVIGFNFYLSSIFLKNVYN